MNNKVKKIIVRGKTKKKVDNTEEFVINVVPNLVNDNNININNQNMKILLDNETDNIKYIYHISDIHIQRDTYRNSEFEKVFAATALNITNHIKNNSNESQSLIVLTGDIIDFKLNVSVNGIKMLTTFLTLMSDICDIIIICGNHDVNVYNSNEEDLILSLHDKIQTKHKIYYLRDSGLYKYKNIVFSHTSVFSQNNKDNLSNIIPANNINNKLIKICLYHGFVYDKIKTHNLSYMLLKSHRTISDFVDYDLVLLGDIYERIFISDKIAYASSLLQMNYGESVSEHGFIIWNIED